MGVGLYVYLPQCPSGRWAYSAKTPSVNDPVKGIAVIISSTPLRDALPSKPR